MDNRKLIVTIRCLAYNHEPYIRQCLEGFVMQQTNFRFEAIVHDDASTDRTAEIIKEYADKYPDIIKPIFETENQYSKHDDSLRRIMNEHTHGKYVASCEGDDYWIDPLKLQKQVDFLNNHQQYSAVFSNCLILEQRKKDNITYSSGYNKRIYNQFDVLCGMMFGLHNICYRKEVLDHLLSLKGINGDMILYYACSTIGNIYRLDSHFSTYRLSGKGIASSRTKEEHLIAKIKERYLFHKLLNFPNNKALIRSQVWILLPMIKHNRNLNVYKTIKEYIIFKQFYIYIFEIIYCIYCHLLKKQLF